MNLLSRTFWLQEQESSESILLFYSQELGPTLIRLLITLTIPAVAASWTLSEGRPLGSDWVIGLAFYLLALWTFTRHRILVEREGNQFRVTVRPLLFQILAPSAVQLANAESVEAGGRLTFIRVKRSSGRGEWVFVPSALTPTADGRWVHERVRDFMNRSLASAGGPDVVADDAGDEIATLDGD